MKYQWTKKYDKLKLGIIFGLIFPIFGFLFAYLAMGQEMSLSSFWHMFIKDANSTDSNQFMIYSETRKNILIYCLIANLALFYPIFFLWKMNRFSKGIVGITLLLTGISFIFIY